MPVDITQEYLDDNREEHNQDDQETTETLTEKNNVAQIKVSQQEDRTCINQQLSKENCCTENQKDEATSNTVSQEFSNSTESERVMDDLPEGVTSATARKPESLQSNAEFMYKNNLNNSANTTTCTEIDERTKQDLDLGLCLSTGSIESLSDNTASRKESAITLVNVNSNCSVSIDLSDHLEEDTSSTQGDQDQLDSEPTCRICHCGNETEPLISPCLCTGTVKHIHHSCLMDWLKRCVKTKCELCLHPITVHRKIKPLKKWRRPGQKPTPIIWLLTFIVALTLNIASIAKDGSQKCVSNPCIIFYVVGALGAMLGFAFFYHWLMVTIRYIKQWMALNEEWTLVACDKASTLGNANLALSDKSLGSKEHQDGITVVEVV